MIMEEVLLEARRVLRHEGETLCGMAECVDESLWLIVEELHACRTREGSVIVCGVGKSALAARKIAATLTVVGMPARFMSPVDAVHGDVGSMAPDRDVLLVVSRSGETEELIRVLDLWSGPTIAITAYAESTIGDRAEWVVVHPAEEACEFGMVPTSSYIAAVAIGDVLALVLQRKFKRTRDDFAQLHVAGTLGRRATVKVKDVMVTGEDVGWVYDNVAVLHALVTLAHKRGTLLVFTHTQEFVGVLTAGDIARRASEYGDRAVWLEDGIDLMVTKDPHITHPDMLLIDAIAQMQENGVMALPVITMLKVKHASDKKMVVGVLHLHDALGARVR